MLQLRCLAGVVALQYNVAGVPQSKCHEEVLLSIHLVTSKLHSEHIHGGL